MPDFPAAHSMDTEWFAIDANGNVGIFDSGEDGAIPKSVWLPKPYASLEEVPIERFIENFLKDERGIVRLPADGTTIAAEASLESLQKVFQYAGRVSDLLLVLASEDVIEELIPDVQLQFSGTETVVYMPQCPYSKLKLLIDNGKVLRGKDDFNLGWHCQTLGFFLFSHDWDGIPSPYRRVGVPQIPLKANELPEALKLVVQKVRFESIHFAEATEIQPIEHLECDTWVGDGQWLDTKRERSEWEIFGEGYDEFEEEAE